MRELLPRNNSAVFQDFSLLEARLRENLDERRYGRDETNRSQYNRIIDELNSLLIRQLHLSISFIDLCKSSNQEDAFSDGAWVERSPKFSQSQPLLWQEGVALTIQGQSYRVDGPVRQWFSREDVLYQCAPGRQASTGQKVWLKQCQVSRVHEGALTARRDIEKEGRLLLRLQQEGQRDFPHLLGSESTAQGATLVYERLSGRSLAEVFSSLAKPLSQQEVRRLLAGRKTLIRMLHALHRMHCSHRMLTPETLLRQPDANNIILMDVGLAACAVRPGEGPDFYRAPEQLRGLPLPNHSTDIYQLGALFYYLLTGQHVTADPTGGESHLPPELVLVLRKAVSPMPGERWPNVYAFSNALRQAGY